MFDPRELALVRDLARRVAEIAALPVQRERVAMWTRHNGLERVRPMVLVFPEGSWRELMPEAGMICQNPVLRDMEYRLRGRVYYHEHLNDDNPIVADFRVHKVVRTGSWGLEPQRVASTTDRGAWAFDPVLKSAADVARLHAPTVTHDADESARRLAIAQEVLGDILPVRLAGVQGVSFHLMSQYSALRGLDQMMMDMVDNPGLIHDVMAIFVDGHRRRIQQLVELNALGLNNDVTYHSSGGNGYTTELPAPGFDPARVRPIDMWASAEAQELALVSPAMHEEFALRYERQLLEPFGLNGYGCCESLSEKMHLVLRIPRLRRVSISPFAGVAKSAEAIGDRCIFSWKPHPAHLVGPFDEPMIRNYIRDALDRTRGCVVEMILKDTHTCDHHPERFTRWVQIARELAEQY